MTPTLAMTVEREASIAAFVPEKFYTVALELTSGFVASSRRISEKDAAEKLLAECRKEMVSTIQKITRKENQKIHHLSMTSPRSSVMQTVCWGTVRIKH